MRRLHPSDAATTAATKKSVHFLSKPGGQLFSTPLCTKAHAFLSRNRKAVWVVTVYTISFGCMFGHVWAASAPNRNCASRFSTRLRSLRVFLASGFLEACLVCRGVVGPDVCLGAVQCSHLSRDAKAMDETLVFFAFEALEIFSGAGSACSKVEKEICAPFGQAVVARRPHLSFLILRAFSQYRDLWTSDGDQKPREWRSRNTLSRKVYQIRLVMSKLWAALLRRWRKHCLVDTCLDLDASCPGACRRF